MAAIDIPTVIKMTEARTKPEIGTCAMTPADAPVAFGHQEQKAIDLLPMAKERAAWAEQLAAHPHARRGTAVLTALASFIAWVLRFKKPETVVFAQPDKLTAVVDYHGPQEGGAPGHMRHRAVYAFPFSREWRFWSTVGQKGRTQSELAEIIEERIADLASPSGDEPEVALLGADIAGPSTMLQLARGIEVRAKYAVKEAVTLASGEARVSFDEEHSTHGKDGTAITVPAAFLVSIPVYEHGDRWRIVVRLRYRVVDRNVLWFLSLSNAEAALKTAFDEVVQDVSTETEVPVLHGSPES